MNSGTHPIVTRLEQRVKTLSGSTAVFSTLNFPRSTLYSNFFKSRWRIDGQQNSVLTSMQHMHGRVQCVR
jgi:hypothetical protein